MNELSLRLGVLDQSPISEGSTAADALRNTLDLARLVDELGYHRYWLAEHHNGPLLAGPSPEVLIGPVAMATERIRVGSGGVMLPHYSPLKVAESFSVLAGLFGDRIDLAIGSAPGTDPMTTFALQRDRRQAAPDDFPHQLSQRLAAPRVGVGVAVVCADTDDEARRLAASSRMTSTLPLRGKLIHVPPPD